jgi:hypothetical protein
MTPDGVALPMTLSHRMLGQLVGARRPTVSTALSELAKEDELHRRDDGTWLLTGAPVRLPPAKSDRAIPIRRRLLPPASATGPDAVHDATAAVPNRKADELRRVREEFASNTGVMREVVVMTTRLTEDNAALRARCLITRKRARNGVVRVVDS